MLLVSRQHLIILIIYASTLCFTNGQPKHQLPPAPADAAKIFENFPSVVAIFDVDNDGDLDCLSAVQTDYDRSVPSVKYVWMLQGSQGQEPRNMTFLVLPGAKQGEFIFKNLDDDGPLQIGTYEYSDYKNCFVLRMPYNSWQECILWVSEEVKDNIPQNCMDYFEDNCENAKLAYDKETCEGIHT